MHIENVTELAFDDITPEDPDFSSIQGENELSLPKTKITYEANFCILFSGLAEAGLITSKLSNRDLLNDVEGTFLFSPERYLCHCKMGTHPAC